MSSENEAQGGSLLESWKEIATYLGVDVRTAQRYEQRDGLPVIRERRGTRGAVYARRQEVDRWLEMRRVGPAIEGTPPPTTAPSETPKPGGWNRRRIMPVFLAVGITLFLAGTAGLNRRPPKPVLARTGRLLAKGPAVRIALDDRPGSLAFHPDGSHLVVTSHDGEKLWLISSESWRITNVIALNAPPTNIFFDGTGSKILITTSTGVAVLDRDTLRVDHIALGSRPRAVAAVGEKIYVTQGRNGLTKVHLPTRRIEAVPGLICPYYPIADAKRGRLYVSCRCGGPGGRPGHDAIDIIDLATERSIGSASGPPMVADAMVPSPAFDHLWVLGSDACIAPYYDRVGCPVTPGAVLHLYRISDGAFVKSLGWPDWIHSVSPHPDGERAVVAASREIASYEHGSLKVISAIGFHVLEEVMLSGVAEAAVAPNGRFVATTLPEKREIAVFRAQSPDCEPPRDRMVALWTGDGTFGADIGHRLRPVGKSGFAPGVLGSAFQFGPEPVYLGRSSDLGPAHAVESGTLAAWIKTGKREDPMPIFAFTRSDQPAPWQLELGADGRLHLQLAEPPHAHLISRSAIPDNVWTHFALVKSKDRLDLFVDGKVESSLAHASPLPLTAFAIGTNPERKRFFQGLLDELVHYDRSLTPQEVRGLFELPGTKGCREAE